MAGPALRFLHASDLHLERPLAGLSEAPDALRSHLVEAPFLAAQRVLWLAIEERVDFVVLSGDICSPVAAGPCGLAILSEAFEKLNENRIPVYWAQGAAESQAEWPSGWQLPPNVHRFVSNRWEVIQHERDGEVVARVGGIGFSQRGLPTSGLGLDNNELPRIAVGYASDRPDVASGRIDYFAVGGRHDRNTETVGQSLVHYPGTSQGRQADETGPHGCTIVEIDTARKLRTRFVPTDRVRWLTQTINVDTDDPSAIRTQLTERLSAVFTANPGIVCLVRWIVAGPPKLAQQINSGTLGAELTEGLRSYFTPATYGVWTVAIEGVAPSLSDELYEQDSLLGELLRSIRLYQEHPESPLDLESLVAERYVAGTIGSAVALSDADARKHTLSNAARLAVDLLTQETRS